MTNINKCDVEEIMNSKLLRVPEVAARLGLKESTIRKMIFERRIPVCRIGRTVSVLENTVDDLIEKGLEEARR